MTDPDSVDPLRDERIRYSRHLRLPEIGPEGQACLGQSSVLCIGAGGLGSPAALYLAAAGVGRIGIVDFDTVDLSNLQRQLLHGTPDVGRPKTDSATETLTDLNPGITIEPHPVRFDVSNAADLVDKYDLVLDGSDNFATRYLANDACFFAGKPCVHGSIYRFEGHLTVLCRPAGPCYRCLYPVPPPPEAVPSCDQAGVLGVLPGVIGCLQATEALKILLGIGTPLDKRLLVYDALDMQFREMRIDPDPACPLCGDQATIHQLQALPDRCPASSPIDSKETASMHDITPEELQAIQAQDEQITLVDVREGFEVDICRLENSCHIPLAELPERLDELQQDRPVVVYCLSGGRSAAAAELLRGRGFADVKNLTGGIRAWGTRLDPSMRLY